MLSHLPLVSGLVATLTVTESSQLSNQSNIVYISLDRPLTPTLSNAAPAVNAFSAWQSGYTGKGIGVAVIDSGVSSHPDLNGGFLGSSRVVWNQSFVPGNASPNDQFGHGTHIAGLIAGNGASSTGPQLFPHFQRHRATGQHHQPASPGSERRWHRQRRDQRDQYRHHLETSLTISV